MRKTAVLVLLTTTVSLSSCYYDKKDLVYPIDNTTCNTSNVTYNIDVKTILTSQCYSCHGSSVANAVGGGIVLDSYAAASGMSSTILAQVQAGVMPKGGPKLSSCDIAKIKKWVDDGAPNN